MTCNDGFGITERSKKYLRITDSLHSKMYLQDVKASTSISYFTDCPVFICSKGKNVKIKKPTS